MIKRKSSDTVLNSIDHYPTGLFVINEYGVIISINNQGLSLLGSKNENLSNRNFLEYLDENGKTDFPKFFQRAYNSTEPKKTKFNIRRIDSGYFEALLIAKPVKLSKSTDKLCSISLFELTDLKMGEEIGKQSEIRFEKMANTAPVMIWIADVDGLFSFVNRVWLDYTGQDIGEQLGMNWLKSVHPDDYEKLLTIYKDAFRSREHFSAEFRFKRMNDEFQWMLINGSPRVSDRSIFTGFIGSCININEQIKNEEKIREINIELSESNNTKDKFFSIISHDLRGPLSGLMQLLEILADEYDSLDEQEKFRLISEAAASAKGTYNLMENLLEWSRIQSEKIEYQPERINLLQLANEIASLYDQNFKNKKINLNVNIKPDISVFTDKKMIETVFRNLISNAIKFTFPEGSVTLSSVKEDDSVIVKIMDSGIGISKENLPQLFRLDVSHSTKGTAKETGTGLGLILCKELVEKQGGKIWVESKMNEGSTFNITIPLAM
jgi:PAS domain S-box-containing protein